jgi:superfamily I DNA/RNA helicase
VFLQNCFTGKGSLILKARAGTGKTTTILGAVKGMRGESLILAFNASIAKELKDKLVAEGVPWKRASASTMHSAGFKAYRRMFPNVEVDKDRIKVPNLIQQLVVMGAIRAEVMPYSATVNSLVSQGKQAAIGIVTHVDDYDAWNDIIERFDMLDDENAEKLRGDIIDAAAQALQANNEQTDFIDFDDMVYLPLVHRCKFWAVDNLFVDEAQDTNAVGRLLIRALVKKGGRVIAVGDDFQAIYGFRGADSDSLDLIQKLFDATVLPLTVTYRCPKSVVAFAQQWCADYHAHPSAPEGTISSSTFEDFIRRPDLNADSAVLCRNTKPLVTAAFALIRAKIPCKIEGREIGDGLKRLATKWNSIKTINALQDKIEWWREREVAKAKAKKKESRVQQVNDEADTIRVIMRACKDEGQHNVSDVVAFIDRLFADNVSGMLTLATIHKSKGREWKRVFWLDRAGTCPSPYAKQDWEVIGERNLQYVAATRSKSELIDLDLPAAKKTQGQIISEAVTKHLASAA